jgi:hypothetical protein
MPDTTKNLGLILSAYNDDEHLDDNKNLQILDNAGGGIAISVTLSSAQLKTLSTSVQCLPPVPGQFYLVERCLAQYKLGPGPIAFGNATGNTLNLQYDTTPSASASARQFFGIETDNAATFGPYAEASIDLTVNTGGSIGFGSPNNNQASGNVMYNAATIGAGVFIVASNGNFTLGDGSVKVTLWYHLITP